MWRPYAATTASSFYDYNDPGAPNYKPFRPQFLNDRRGWAPVPAGGPPAPFMASNGLRTRDGVPFRYPRQVFAALNANYQDGESSWVSAKEQAVGEWVELRWPQSYQIQSIRLVGVLPTGGDWNGFGSPAQDGPFYVDNATLNLYLDGALVDGRTTGRIEPLDNGGTLITFNTPLEIDRLRLRVDAVTGRWHWDDVAALNEIEVIGQAAEAWPLLEISYTYLPVIQR
ncbi:MAG: hypothetical protein HC804_06320 [Anaerolineae bacterium]|nr:hypothetical protein [Anaerolineae bacterium]